MTKRADGRYQESILVDGKRKYFYGKTKREVLNKVREYEHRKSTGTTMSEALDLWLEHKEPSISYKTYEGYKAPIQRIKDRFGDMPVLDITSAHIQAFVTDLAGQGYKRSTVQRPLDVMRMTFNFLIVQPNSKIQYNPCNAVRLPSGLTQQRREIASREDVAIVRNSLRIEFGLFAYLIMYSGLRDGEALALTDRDFTEHHISVSKSVSWQTNQPIIKSPKTKSGVRKVDLLDPLKKALPKKWSGYLFSADGGKTPLTKSEFRARWNNYCRAAGLADSRIETHKSKGLNNRSYDKRIWSNRIVPYQLRHEYATMCFDAGLDPHDVMVLMGHANEAMAREIYTHILDSRRRKSAEKLNQYVNNM